MAYKRLIHNRALIETDAIAFGKKIRDAAAILADVQSRHTAIVHPRTATVGGIVEIEVTSGINVALHRYEEQDAEAQDKLQRLAVKLNRNTVSTLAFAREVSSEEKHALTVGVAQ
jgi:hypothetical protein